MKKSLLIIVLCTIVSGFSIYAQAQIEQCGTMKLLKEHLAADPGLKARLQQTEANAKAWASSNAKAASVVVWIPTVVHVIHNLTVPAQNIPDSVIYSQIEVLNEDFRRMNADAVNTRPIFDSIAADVEVEFCLASVDAAGNATTGINRVASTETGFEVFGAGMNDMKYTANGGADAWPRDQYLNIWVCNMTIFGTPGAILGFAQFPGDDPATDGVAIQFTFMGRTNDPVQSDSSLGRTVTHEVGHWLGLRHIWADDQDFFGNGTCDSSDFVDDTPNQEGASTYDCNMVINSCSVETPYWGTTDPPDMVENFMDYSSDSCSNMFSMGQKVRMLSFLNTDRVSLLTSPACGALSTVSTPTCAGSCTGQTSVTVNTGTPPFTYLWNDPALQTNSTATGLCAGTYSIVITDALGQSSNDTVIVSSLDSLSVSVSTVDASCSTCADGIATANVSGGLTPYSYLWTDSGGNTVDPSLGLTAGSYNVAISDGCNEQDLSTFSIGAPIFVTHLTPFNGLRIYPNPSFGTLTISPDLKQSAVSIQIVNGLGQIIREWNITGHKNLDISDLEPGIYFVKATIKGSSTTKKLLLIQ